MSDPARLCPTSLAESRYGTHTLNSCTPGWWYSADQLTVSLHQHWAWHEPIRGFSECCSVYGAIVEATHPTNTMFSLFVLPIMMCGPCSLCTPPGWQCAAHQLADSVRQRGGHHAVWTGRAFFWTGKKRSRLKKCCTRCCHNSSMNISPSARSRTQTRGIEYVDNSD
jgi:hypothetical protein